MKMLSDTLGGDEGEGWPDNGEGRRRGGDGGGSRGGGGVVSSASVVDHPRGARGGSPTQSIEMKTTVGGSGGNADSGRPSPSPTSPTSPSSPSSLSSSSSSSTSSFPRPVSYGLHTVFGEMALLTGEPCLAAAVAFEKTRCLKISRRHLDVVLGETPVLRDAFAQVRFIHNLVRVRTVQNHVRYAVLFSTSQRVRCDSKRVSTVRRIECLVLCVTFVISVPAALRFSVLLARYNPPSLIDKVSFRGSLLRPSSSVLHAPSSLLRPAWDTVLAALPHLPRCPQTRASTALRTHAAGALSPERCHIQRGRPQIASVRRRRVCL